MKTIALRVQFHYTYALNFYNTFLIIFVSAFIFLDFYFVSGLYYHHYKLKAMYDPYGVQPRYLIGCAPFLLFFKIRKEKIQYVKRSDLSQSW